MTHEEHGIQGEIRKVETLWFSEQYRLRDLLKRAADALANILPCLSGGSKITILSLIAELRKAAAE